MWLGSVGSTAMDVSLWAPVLCVMFEFLETLAPGAANAFWTALLNGTVLKLFGVGTARS